MKITDEQADSESLARVGKMSSEPYTTEELRQMATDFPDRGEMCRKCNMRVPEFANLSEHDAGRVRALIDADDRVAATKLLQDITGCPLTWAKIWVTHSGRPSAAGEFAGPPCPRCGRPLRTNASRQCPHCFADWH